MTRTLLVFSNNYTNQKLAERLRQKNIEVIFYQPYEFGALNWDPLSLNVDIHHKVILTSPSAVEFGFKMIAHLMHHHHQIYAIGGITAEHAQTFTIQPISHANNFSSEALLALNELQKLDEQQILIFKGAHGRDLLAKVLQHRGASITNVLCYERQYHFDDLTSATEIWQNRQIDACLVSSVEIFEQLLQHFPESKKRWFQELTFIVPSKRIKTHLEYLGFTQLVLAENYSVDALFNVCQFIGTPHEHTG